MEKIKDLQLHVTINPVFEHNFRYLMSKVANTEWGGIVVYDLKNYFADKEIHIELLDFMLLDIGSVAQTAHTYADSPEITTLLMKHFKKPYGLIHSHVTGEVYYSSIDTEEIIKREKYYPEGYLSVVTNTRGDILTRFSKYFETVTTVQLTVGDTIKKSITKTKSLHYAENKININPATKSVDERLNILEAKKIQAEKVHKKSKANIKQFNSIHNVVDMTQSRIDIEEQELQEYFDDIYAGEQGHKISQMPINY